jgi:hypothetical protein
MEKSDEVILATQTNIIAAIAPSGEDVVTYYDVKVLRTWKGSHKVGDTLTFSEPSGIITCTRPHDYNQVGKGQSLFQTITDGGPGPLGSGPHILFLRQSHGNEVQLTPGLRLTGGDGMQGAFSINFPYESDEYKNCSSILSASAEKCNPILEASQAPIFNLQYSTPLFKEYGKMPISEFLKEVQATADSLGYTSSSAVTK